MIRKKKLNKKGNSMSAIKECYEPLYEAINELKKVKTELGKRNNLLDYFEGMTDKKKKKYKNLDKLLKKKSKKRKKTKKELILPNLAYWGGNIALHIFLVILGMKFPPFYILTWLFYSTSINVYINRDSLPKLFRHEIEYNLLEEYNEELEERGISDDLKTLENVLKKDIRKLEEKCEKLELYITTESEQLLEENRVLVQEIFQENNIDGEMELTVTNLKLNRKKKVLKLYEILKK